MNNFEYYNPTKVVFGEGEFQKLGAEVKMLGDTALLVKQEGPLEEMGVYKKAADSMEAEGVTVHVLEYVTSNPKLSKIREGVRIAKEKEINVVVAVGGGSAIDAGKAVALGAPYEGDVRYWFPRKGELRN